MNANLCHLFLALSDMTRLAVVRSIGFGEMSVGELVEKLGESQPKVSRHLAFLRNSGVVAARRSGKNIYYSLDLAAGTEGSRILKSVLCHLIGDADEAVYAVNEPGADENDNIYAQPYIIKPSPSNDIDIFLL